MSGLQIRLINGAMRHGTCHTLDMTTYQILHHGRLVGSPGFTLVVVEPKGHITPIIVYETEAEAKEALLCLKRRD
jgi:hypothetical protein